MTQATTTDANVMPISNGESSELPADPKEVSRDGPFFEGTDVPVRHLFDYLDEGYNLYTFLKHFPSIDHGQAVAALKARVRMNRVIHSDRQIVSGTPVFRGTRVPLYILFEYLTAGENLDEFLDCYPTVSREQAIETLTLAQNALEIFAYETSAR